MRSGIPFGVAGLNFGGSPPDFTSRAKLEYYLDRRGNIYARNLADLVVGLNKDSDGAVMERLGRIYDAILIDEVQDLVGWDLEVLDLLLDADVNLLMVGDPRQHTYATSRSSKNRKYRGAGFADWLEERKERCRTELRVESYRCNQALCDFADAIFPNLPAITS